ncbi:unnamed protein product [Parascedosporium putredinis]|uniref:Secreted protein n=1 Tax=Parascedosporium putredinis TaxID=1442378 RepID=A0A9P1MDW6_9PEZI|nr:unnamed protein product [Parascedosporium putredinis]CAI8003412.1 unnamed protein product [Parascedosporium putredinis]
MYWQQWRENPKSLPLMKKQKEPKRKLCAYDRAPRDLASTYCRSAASDVKIVGISAIGSGCPAGHAFATVDSTGTIFDVAFDQFSVVDTTFSGYASLAAGQTGTCRAAYSFSGGGASVAAQKTIRGPVETNYEMNEKVDIITWSQCGDYTAILNVNSEVRISPTSSTSKGLMTVDSFDGRLHVQFMASWRRC